MFAVMPDYRSKGIGQGMMDTFFQITCKMGSDRVILEVRESNLKAQRLYYKNDFKKIEEIKGLYVSGELAYRLEKKL